VTRPPEIGARIGGQRPRDSTVTRVTSFHLFIVYSYDLECLAWLLLRTAYSDESNALWPTAMEKLRRWVTQDFIHTDRVTMNKNDISINEELRRRFIVEVFDNTDSEKLKLPNLAKTS
jgi:hypothetical protein